MPGSADEWSSKRLTDVRSDSGITVPDMTRPDFLMTTRDAYDAVAADYARLVGTELTDATEGPVDRESHWV